MNQTKKKRRMVPLLVAGVLSVALLVVICLRIFAGATPKSTPSDSAGDAAGSQSTDSADVAKKDMPYAVESTDPSTMLRSTAISVNDQIVENYQAKEAISFAEGAAYTEQKGILTFRGNNFRDTAAYGTVALEEKAIGTSWQTGTDSLSAPDGAAWTGSGWTGQALVIQWSEETRQNMNLYDTAREKADLVEVIYPTMDGRIYFLDLETGQHTRDPINVGYTFKGCGSLDPRGYPILYVGAGYDSYEGGARAFVISLIDGSILYEFGAGDSFALRELCYFDSSPLVDAETDQLIYPGENGVLYLIKLNTSYDAEAGTLAIDPDPVVKWRYEGARSSAESYWLGMEDSAVIWNGSLFVADNGGYMMCLDLETLQVLWVQDVLDDTNCSPVLELEDGHPYLYISTSFHSGWRAGENESTTIPVWKLDAMNGEIVWQTEYTCYTAEGVSGGVQGTLAIGKNNLSDLLFVPVAKTTSSTGGGVLAALDKETGETVWELETQSDYSWSSPVAVYDEAGDGYIIYTTFLGSIYLLDGRTGETLDRVQLEGHLEASPVVYDNTVVIGTRDQKIFSLTLR